MPKIFLFLLATFLLGFCAGLFAALISPRLGATRTAHWIGMPVVTGLITAAVCGFLLLLAMAFYS